MREEEREMKSAAKIVPPPPIELSLEERIADLHEEIEALIEARIDELAAQTPGVPKGCIRQAVFGRAGGCLCAATRILREKEN
jgi:hypothetical protein